MFSNIIKYWIQSYTNPVRAATNVINITPPPIPEPKSKKAKYTIKQ